MDANLALTKTSHLRARRVWLLSAVLTLMALSAAAFVFAPAEMQSTCDFWFTQIDGAIPALNFSGAQSPQPSLVVKSQKEQDIDVMLAQLQAHVNDGPQTSSIEMPHSSSFDRDDLLSDPDNRVSEDFKISDDMKDRVGFWFDVYTKYTSDDRVIHHQKYPWIVFKVINVAPIIYATLPPHRWLRNVKADKFVQSETKRVRSILLKIAKTKNLERLSPEENEIAETLKSLPGKIQKNARDAAKEVRIQTGQKDFFSDGLQISSRYLNDMDVIFAAAKIPTELTRLPLVESSFNHLATSKAGASGIWQFIGGTGRKFLLVDGPIDERRSPFKATIAAASLLKENHLILYRSWPLAITAYNHGPAGVKKAVHATGSRDLAKIVRRYNTKSFNFASSNYYSEFLAALFAEKYKDKIFSYINFTDALQDDSVILPRSIKTKQLLKVTGLTSDELTLHNPDLIKAITMNASVPKGFHLHIPSSIKEALEAKLALARRGRLSAWNG